MSMLFACLLLADTTFSLRRAPQVGEVCTYESAIEFTKNGVTTSLESKNDQTILALQNDGSYTVRTKSEGALVRSNGQEVRDDRPSTADTVYGADGRLLRVLAGTGSGMALRVGSMTKFVAPSKPILAGETYTIKRDADQDGHRSSLATYVLSSVQENVATLDYQYLETSGTDRAEAKGSWTVDAMTGVPLSLTLKVKNFNTGLGDVTAYKLKKVSS